MPTLVVKGQTVLLDEEDLRRAVKYKWTLSNGYARSDYGKRKYIYLHTLVLGEPPAGKVTDHINRDKLDNRRINLRFVSLQANARNSSQIVKGYYWRADRNKWVVRFRVRGALTYFGHYDLESEAREKATATKERLLQESLQ